MKTLAAILFTCLLGFFAQPLLKHRAVAKEQATAHACCGKEKDAEKSGCHKDAEEDKGCCGEDGCNLLCTQCPVCAVLAPLPRAHELSARPGDALEVRLYPSLTVLMLSSYLAEMLHPPEVA